MKAELDNAQQRIDSLERELQYTDQGAAIRFLEENPDADYPEVVEHVQDTAPDRVTRFFEEFEEAHAGRTFDGREIDTSDIPGGKLPFSDEEDNE